VPLDVIRAGSDPVAVAMRALGRDRQKVRWGVRPQGNPAA
jgi:hypothetical protein